MYFLEFTSFWLLMIFVVLIFVGENLESWESQECKHVDCIWLFLNNFCQNIFLLSFYLINWHKTSSFIPRKKIIKSFLPESKFFYIKLLHSAIFELFHAVCVIRYHFCACWKKFIHFYCMWDLLLLLLLLLTALRNFNHVGCVVLGLGKERERAKEWRVNNKYLLLYYT